MNNTTMLDQALGYAAMGWPVFPCETIRNGTCSCGDPKCQRPGKHPRTRNGFKDATTSAPIIRQWWTQWPDANIALWPPVGLVMVDADVKPDSSGLETLQTLTEANGGLPDTVTAMTGGGGLHLYFTTGPEVCTAIGSRTNVLPGIDTRTHSGYVLLPPSRHISGKVYEWELSSVPPEVAVAPMPEWLQGALLEAVSKDKSPKSATQADASQKAYEGQRNTILFKLASSLRAKGLHADAILAALLIENKKRCSPPLEDREVQTIAKSGGKYSQGEVSAGGPAPSITPASDIPYEPPRWLIPPYFQRGKGTMVQADNGTGKTALVCAVAAHVSTGRPLLNSEVVTPGNVLILSVEDDLPVLRGRLEASGADLTKCHFMTNAAGLTFNSPEIEEAIKRLNARMVIFDPLQAFLGAGVDMHRSNETRPELARLFEMAARNDCNVTIIAHMAKGSFGASAVNRALGSVDIPAAMRSILQLGRNPENDSEIIAVHVKCSNAPIGRSISFSIGDRGGVTWNGYSDLGVEDLENAAKRKEKGVEYDHEPLVQVFRQLITDMPGGGFWPYADLKAVGMKILGFPPFSDAKELKAKLESRFARELQEKDGLIVVCGARQKTARGVRLERYIVPTSYQTKMGAEG